MMDDKENLNESKKNNFQSNFTDERQMTTYKGVKLEYGKAIKLLRNGDEFHTGQKVVINSRKYRYLDVLLDDLSNILNARFGAVRCIYTPVNGHRVTDLENIEDGGTYVAGGGGRFRKLKFVNIMLDFKNSLQKLMFLYFYLVIWTYQKDVRPYRHE
jgi:hypothetical protein